MQTLFGRPTSGRPAKDEATLAVMELLAIRGAFERLSTKQCNTLLKYTSRLDDENHPSSSASLTELIFNEMRVRGVHTRNEQTYTTVGNHLANKGHWRRAMQLLDELDREERTRPSDAIYGVVFKALHKPGRGQEALDVYSRMQSIGLFPGRVSTNYLMAALSKAGMAGSAFDVFAEAKERGVAVNLNTYTIAIQAAGTLHDPERAVALLNECRSAGISPDLVAYASAMRVAADAGHLQTVDQLYTQMKSDGISPSSGIFTFLLLACAEAGSPTQALTYLREQKSLYAIPIRTNDYQKLFRAYQTQAERGEHHHGLLDELLGHLASMREEGPLPDNVCYATCMEIASLLRDRQMAARLVEDYEQNEPLMSPYPSLKVYGTAMECYERAGDQQAMAAVWRDKVSPIASKVRSKNFAVPAYLWELVGATYSDQETEWQVGRDRSMVVESRRDSAKAAGGRKERGDGAAAVMTAKRKTALRRSASLDAFEAELNELLADQAAHLWNADYWLCLVELGRVMKTEREQGTQTNEHDLSSRVRQLAARIVGERSQYLTTPVVERAKEVGYDAGGASEASSLPMTDMVQQVAVS